MGGNGRRHHSTAFTLDVDTHVVPGMQRQAAETLVGLILPDRSPKPARRWTQTTSPEGSSADGTANVVSIS